MTHAHPRTASRLLLTECLYHPDCWRSRPSHGKPGE
jgi:hypothetical protein